MSRRNYLRGDAEAQVARIARLEELARTRGLVEDERDELELLKRRRTVRKANAKRQLAATRDRIEKLRRKRDAIEVKIENQRRRLNLLRLQRKTVRSAIARAAAQRALYTDRRLDRAP